MKILAVVLGILITVVMLAAGAGLFMMLIITMNGYSDKDGGVALQFYIGWAIAISIIFGIVGAALGFYFASRQPPKNLAYGLSTGGTLVVGLLVEIIGGFVLTLSIAEYLRGK